MSHVPEVPHPPSSLSFGTVEALESWLQSPEPRQPDPRQCITTIVAAPEALKIVLHHADSLPTVKALYTVRLELAKPERSRPQVLESVGPVQTVASHERRSTSPDLRRSGDNADSLRCNTADATGRRSSVSEWKPGRDAASTGGSSPPPTSLNGAVAIVYYGSHPTQAGRDGTISSESRSEPPIIWPLLEVVHGDLIDVVELGRRRKGRIHELLVRLPPGALTETMSREQFDRLALAADPRTLHIEMREDEWTSLSSALRSMQGRLRCGSLHVSLQGDVTAATKHIHDGGSSNMIDSSQVKDVGPPGSSPPFIIEDALSQELRNAKVSVERVTIII